MLSLWVRSKWWRKMLTKHSSYTMQGAIYPPRHRQRENTLRNSRTGITDVQRDILCVCQCCTQRGASKLSTGINSDIFQLIWRGSVGINLDIPLILNYKSYPATFCMTLQWYSEFLKQQFAHKKKITIERGYTALPDKIYLYGHFFQFTENEIYAQLGKAICIINHCR